MLVILETQLTPRFNEGTLRIPLDIPVENIA